MTNQHVASQHEHPDIRLFHTYNDGIDSIHLHIVPLKMPDFCCGLELAYTYINQEEAVKMAITVQKYLDEMVLYMYKQTLLKCNSL